MMSEWRRPKRVGACIEDALHPRLRAGLAGWRAVELWPAVAGATATRKSAAVSFRDGKLFVEVVNHVWMTELSATRHTYVAAINRELGAAVVREIVFRINPRLVS